MSGVERDFASGGGQTPLDPVAAGSSFHTRAYCPPDFFAGDFVRPFKLAAIVTGGIGLVLIGVLVVGFALPSTWETERTVRIQAPPDRVFPHLNSAAAWEAWTPSPESGVERFGPAEGEGSGRRWDDPGYGAGEFVITRVDAPRSLEYRVDVEGGSIRIDGELHLQPVDGSTELRWIERGDFGWNPLMGYLAGRMEAMQGEQLQASLDSLATLVEDRADG